MPPATVFKLVMLLAPYVWPAASISQLNHRNAMVTALMMR
jgi:hypothetical protein